MSEQKTLSAFVSSIEERAERDSRALLGEFQRQRRQELDEQYAEMLQERSTLLQQARTRAQKDAGRMLSAMLRESNSVISNRQMEILEEVFAKVEARLAAFVKTAEYDAFLKQSAAVLCGLSSGDMQIFLGKADFARLDSIRSFFPENCSFAEDAFIRIGGLRASYDGGKRLADDTLDARLEVEKKHFIETSGLHG